MILLCSLVSASEAQISGSQSTSNPNRKGFLAGAAYICNYSGSKGYIIGGSNSYFLVNSNPEDSLYRFGVRNRSTGTFGVYAAYNKPFAKKWSFSIGLEVDQRKQLAEYFLYDNAKLNAPDPVSYQVTQYALFVPLRINYYTRRFIISVGNKAGFVSDVSTLTTYSDESKNNMSSHELYPLMNLRESLSYQLLKDKRIYLQLSAEQNREFYLRSGYNNFFLAGGACYF